MDTILHLGISSGVSTPPSSAAPPASAPPEGPALLRITMTVDGCLRICLSHLVERLLRLLNPVCAASSAGMSTACASKADVMLHSVPSSCCRLGLIHMPSKSQLETHRCDVCSGHTRYCIIVCGIEILRNTKGLTTVYFQDHSHMHSARLCLMCAQELSA